MSKFTSFDENDFYTAIEKKDKARLINCIFNAIRNNPGFKKMKGQDYSEATYAIHILSDKFPDIFDKYEVLEGEEVYEENKTKTWSKEQYEDYFLKQTILLEENFSMKRYQDLKRIAKKIDENFQDPQEQSLSQEQSNQTPSMVLKQGEQNRQKRNPLLLVSIIALLVIVLVVIVAVKQ